MTSREDKGRRLAWAITAGGVALLAIAAVGWTLYDRAALLWIAIAVMGGFALPQAHLYHKHRGRPGPPRKGRARRRR